MKEHGVYASPVLGMPLLGQMFVSSFIGTKRAKFSATGALPVKEIKRLMALLLEIIEAGNLIGVVDRSYSLEEIVDAHEYVDKGHKTGNVVLKPVA